MALPALAVTEDTEAGVGRIAIARVGERSAVTRAFAKSPLRILTPRNHGHAAWAYVTSFGGGLLEGDSLRLSVDVGTAATAFVSTQGPTRIFQGQRGCRSTLDASIADAALWVSVPDPLSLFARARLQQRMAVHLAGAESSVLFVDMLGAGRVARGERWAFASLDSTLRFVRGDEPLLDERLWLDEENGSVAMQLGRFEALGTMICVGPRVTALAEALHSSLRRERLARGADVIASASALPRGDGVFIRYAATTVEGLVRRIRRDLSPLPTLLGDDPLVRRL